MQVLGRFRRIGSVGIQGSLDSNPAATMGIAINVPFEFVVGTYTFRRNYRFEALRSSTPGVCVLAVRGENGECHKLAVSTTFQLVPWGVRGSS